MHCFLNPASMTPTQHRIVIQWTRGVRRTRTQHCDGPSIGHGCSISHTLGGLGVRFRTAGEEGKGKGGHTLTLSAGEAPDEDLARQGLRHSLPVWLSPPLGKKAAERQRERERERTSVRRVRRPKKPTNAPGAGGPSWFYSVITTFFCV